MPPGPFIMFENLRTYSARQCVQFVTDMERACFAPRHYRGRHFWQGPAVFCARTQFLDVIRATNVSLLTDQIGAGFVVYPTTPDAGKDPHDSRIPCR